VINKKSLISAPTETQYQVTIAFILKQLSCGWWWWYYDQLSKGCQQAELLMQDQAQSPANQYRQRDDFRHFLWHLSFSFTSMRIDTVKKKESYSNVQQDLTI